MIFNTITTKKQLKADSLKALGTNPMLAVKLYHKQPALQIILVLRPGLHFPVFRQTCMVITRDGNCVLWRREKCGCAGWMFSSSGL